MLFSHKVIDKRGKKMDGNDSIDHSVAPSVTAGASISIFPQSVKLCQKETAKFNKKYAFTLRKI